MSAKTTHLDDIVQNANRGANMRDNSRITCTDGFSLSVIAGGGTYCRPRPTLSIGGRVRRPDNLSDVSSAYTGPFTAVEVGFPSDRPEPWGQWREYCENPEDPTDTVYGFVPVELVRALIESHGGDK